MFNRLIFLLLLVPTLAVAQGSLGPKGDITGVTATAPLSGGAQTGQATVGLQLCTGNQVLKMNGGGTAWACSADADTTYSAGTNLSLSTTTFSLATNPVIAGTLTSTAGETFLGNQVNTVNTPTALAANQNDYTPTGGIAMSTTAFIRQSATTNVTITGLTGGTASSTKSRSLTFTNISAFNITLAHQSASSTANNRFLFSTGADLVLPPNGSVALLYDPQTNFWRNVASTVVPVSGVTNITTTAPIAGGPITSTGAISLTPCSTNQVYRYNGSAWACVDNVDVIQSITGVTGTVNALAVSSTATTVFLTQTGTVALNGIANGAAGRRFRLVLNAAQLIGLQTENAGATATDRLMAPGGADFTFMGPTVINFVYDTVNNRWTYGPVSTYMPSLTVAGNGNVGQNLAANGYVASGLQLYAGSANSVFLRPSDQSLGFGEATNATLTGYINKVGYHEGILQFRNLEVDDGKGAAIIFVDGATKTTAFSGSVAVTGNANINTISASNSNTAQTTGAAAGRFDEAGSFNTTAGALSAYAGRFNATSTRSAGANNLTNYGVWTSAASGQANYGLWVDAGDYMFNTGTRGTVAGPLTFTGSGDFRDQTTAPTITGTPANCGTGATINSGGNHGFTFTSGTSVSTCVITFGRAFATAPTCIAQTHVSGGQTWVSATSTTSMTVTGAASGLSGAVVDVICIGH